MSIAIVHDEPAFVTCKRCAGRGSVGAPGLDPDYCVECGGHGEIALDLSDLATLAHNLAWGAALCRAHRNGIDSGGDGYGMTDGNEWRPGCGKEAP